MTNPDYIIIGAGPAGCVLCARLSEDGGTNVLLLEAGGTDRRFIISMPAAVPFTYQDKRLGWGEEAGPEPHLDGRMIDEKRGRVLGGSTSINAMIFNRGNPHDFDSWAALGLAGWGWRDVLPYFKRMETFAEGANDTRGGSGPLKIRRAEARHKLYDLFVQACEQAGHRRPADHNSGDQEGVHIAQQMVGDGHRCNAAQAYLHPNLHRPNLALRRGVVVRRILFEGDRATGVELATGEKIYAGREVLVASGTVGAAKLLLLSGVGPADELRALGLPVLLDQPNVGRNLENHPGVNVQHICRHEDSLVSELGLVGRARLGLEWLLFRRGLGTSSFFETGAFIKSRDDVDYPDLRFEFLPLARRLVGHQLEAIPGYQQWVELSRPKSRGHVRLRSADPSAAPEIIFNYLSKEDDCRDMVQAVRLARDLFAQQAWNAVRGQEIGPGAEAQTDADILAWVRRSVGTGYHAAGSCRMAVRPADGVVDGNGKVHGLQGLRVVCAAIMPQIVNGNLSATTYMMAEKIADDIRDSRTHLARGEARSAHELPLPL
ncbi:choline dehydrogenase [Mesorhizobium sp. PL10]